MRTQPQRGFTTKPGVAVTTAHPRKNRTKSSEPQRGSTLPGQFFRFSFSIGGCGTPLWFGVIPISLPGVRRNAATPGFVRVEAHDFPQKNLSRRRHALPLWNPRRWLGLNENGGCFRENVGNVKASRRWCPGLKTTEPIYTPRNVTSAYQLNWGLTVFWRQQPVADDQWLNLSAVLTTGTGTTGIWSW